MPQDEPRRYRLAAMHGAVSAIVLAFPVSAIVALFYRFPIPFAGKFGGPEAVPGAIIAVMIYGCLMLGFIPLAGVGAATGMAMAKFTAARGWPTLRTRIYGGTFAIDTVIAAWMAYAPF